MEVSRIIAEIDSEIAKLHQARALLADIASATSSKGPGRPKGTKNAKGAAAPAPPRKRRLSPEGRKRIAEAMKRRWAERRKQAGKGSTSTK